jgi:hypothetical protein
VPASINGETHIRHDTGVDVLSRFRSGVMYENFFPLRLPDEACYEANALGRLTCMNSPFGDAKEYEQRLNAIYAWSRLLQVGALDPALRARALESIQQNTERLLRNLTGKVELA